MISEVRSFIRSRVLEEDSAFKEWKDGFNSENIPSSILNKSYHVLISNPSNIVTENCLVDDNISAEVKLYFKGGKNIQDALDNAMETAYNIKLRSSNPSNYTDVIKYVSVDSVIPDPLPTNDNSILITLNYTLRIISVVI